jgi:predicted nuclease of predicted toxin-antitoxin system
MKLLLDENLSRRLVPFLKNAYPDSSQVVLLGLESATDLSVWKRAQVEGYVIVTRDADFEELSIILGQPPKVIWIRGKNHTRSATLKILLDQQGLIENVLFTQGQACIEITQTTGV